MFWSVSPNEHQIDPPGWLQGLWGQQLHRARATLTAQTTPENGREARRSWSWNTFGLKHNTCSSLNPDSLTSLVQYVVYDVYIRGSTTNLFVQFRRSRSKLWWIYPLFSYGVYIIIWQSLLLKEELRVVQTTHHHRGDSVSLFSLKGSEMYMSKWFNHQLSRGPKMFLIFLSTPHGSSLTQPKHLVYLSPNPDPSKRQHEAGQVGDNFLFCVCLQCHTCSPNQMNQLKSFWRELIQESQDWTCSKV